MTGITRMTASGILIPEDKQAVEQAAKREKIEERAKWAFNAYEKLVGPLVGSSIEPDPAVSAAIIAEMMRQDAAR